MAHSPVNAQNWHFSSALINIKKFTYIFTFKFKEKQTLETLTRWLKWSTMLAMSVSTLSSHFFCFLAAANAAADVGPLPVPPPTPAPAPPPPPPPLFILPCLFFLTAAYNARNRDGLTDRNFKWAGWAYRYVYTSFI